MNSSPPPAAPPLPSAAVHERLARERNAWLCTVRPDGTPHATPVWFVFSRGSWWVGTDASSVKVRNIERFPGVCLMLEGGDRPVVAEGEAVLYRGPFPERITEAFTEKYAWDAVAPYEGGGARVLLEIPVRRWLLAGTAP
ncbi:pyridoxamine 5'-phosphate oxidase family protein [uncultured Streptomyces sp.]|uniref:pyridoxamine 5'-phosphate oxidase family protein n=1 Tax=uncultured Streptomyces sp. TaxID=174707 RepID=UPI00262110B3|nr:pyridoxamine 5'-phosphate oxidase family protein [uncultured Streptomyces sp.]